MLDNMAHFAEIDENNIVIRILVVPNEHEDRGQEYLTEDLGLIGKWIQTSYNDRIRNTFAGIGYSYNEELDMFIPPKPYPSWILNAKTGNWEAPIEKPTTLKVYWDEENQIWGGRYLILKELLPSLEGMIGYDENLAYISKCSCIENDEIFVYNTLIETENKIKDLKLDKRYEGRRFKIKEII